MLAIIDYQMGNLRSVQKAFERVGHEATITSDPDAVRRADKVVLPGVGAFEDAIAELRRAKPRRADPRIDRARTSHFSAFASACNCFSTSATRTARTKAWASSAASACGSTYRSEYKVPHMGWNRAVPRRRPPIFAGLSDEPHFYFVHSYYVVPQDASVIATETDYAGPFCSMVWRDNLFATQFHPEKSQAEGLRLLKNFAEL